MRPTGANLCKEQTNLFQNIPVIHSMAFAVVVYGHFSHFGTLEGQAFNNIITKALYVALDKNSNQDPPCFSL